jgi:hypothetical protein
MHDCVTIHLTHGFTISGVSWHQSLRCSRRIFHPHDSLDEVMLLFLSNQLTIQILLLFEYGRNLSFLREYLVDLSWGLAY